MTRNAKIAVLSVAAVALVATAAIAATLLVDNFVYPDEEAYALLPAPPSPVAIPSGWPFDALRARLLD